MLHFTILVFCCYDSLKNLTHIVFFCDGYSLEAGRTNPFGVTESDVRRGGHQISLCQFKQRADLLEQIIRAGEDNTPCDVEVST